jgi:adenylyltransferase/sulfurtransferase
LKAAHVLVIGSGGLGSPLLLYLAAAGVGNLGIVDFDTIDESNLQRQVLFSTGEIGRSKVDAAKERLLQLNPHINIQTYQEQLNSENALELLKQYDVIADGTDNFPARYLVNDACVILGKPNVYASIFQFEGQVSVFNYIDGNGCTGPNYRDLYPTPPPPGLVPSCAEGGVLGVLPGIIGSLQALEVIKIITGIGDPLNGRLYTFDALSFTSRIFNIRRQPNNPLNGESQTITKLVDYEQFCGVKAVEKPVREITPQEFSEWKKNGVDFQLVDVREPEEYLQCHLGGVLVPVETLLQQAHKIDRHRKVVVHCKGGSRSLKAIRLLEEIGFDNLYNLKGGIMACSNLL